MVLESLGSGPGDQERVAGELSGIFGKPPERFRELGPRLPMVIRRGLAREEADTLIDLLLRAGASVRLEPAAKS